MLSTDSPAESGQITLSVFVGSIIGVYILGISMGSLLGVGLMKLLQNYRTKMDISKKQISSKNNVSLSHNETICYDDVVLADDSSGINLSENIAYGEVKRT